MTIEYLEKEFLELGLQPVAGGDFRQDVALVEITGSGQRLSFNKGAGGMTLAYGDDMVIGSRRVQPRRRSRAARSCSSATASTRPNTAGTTTPASTCTARRR